MKLLLPPAVVVATVMCLVPSASAQSACPGSDTTATANVAVARDALICMINNERTTRGLPALTVNVAIDQAAQLHADDMVARDFKSITAPAPAPNGVSPRDRATNTGYPASNDLTGFAGWNVTGTPRDVMEFQMRRGQDACPSVLGAQATDIGVGTAAAADGMRYFVNIGGAAISPRTSTSCPVTTLATPKPGAAPTKAEQKKAAQALAKKSANTVAGALGFPGAKACQSKRAFKIRIKETKLVKIKSATLDLVGRKIKTKRVNGRLVGTVDLRGFAKGTFVLKISATSTTGVKLKGTRKYKTCAKQKSAKL